MGMDVYGKNPKQNKDIGDFPTLLMMKKLEIDEKWEERRDLLEKNDDVRDKYWEEKDKYESSNKGTYFRNNCWWWRPLWNYCYLIADDLISEELYESGHHNNGSGLDDKDARLLGNRLLQQIREGKTIEYQAEYQQHQDDLPDDDFDKSYPFDVDNVKEFAEFCLQSGGFEIN